MELSLAPTTATNTAEIDQNYSLYAAGGSSSAIEKEHMFDKVVTPSDVGKLNRLVIPKQHAEKHFPLGSSSIEKGILMSFEDRNGKPWRFRYSYWNSSQSYVMTKGWSRFVKEKKLDAGDTVSFQRGIGESGRNRLFIDWQRRPNFVSDYSSFWHLNPNQQIHQSSVQFPQHWTGRLHQLQQKQLHFNSAPFYDYTLRPPPAHPDRRQLLHHHQHLPIVLDSVPVEQGKTVRKRLRLFGVNMECPTEDEDRVHPIQTDFSKKEKSVSFSSSVYVDSDL